MKIRNKQDHNEVVEVNQLYVGLVISAWERSDASTGVKVQYFSSHWEPVPTPEKSWVDVSSKCAMDWPGGSRFCHVTDPQHCKFLFTLPKGYNMRKIPFVYGGSCAFIIEQEVDT